MPVALCVWGLGVDGRCYVLEDASVKRMRPLQWADTCCGGLSPLERRPHCGGSEPGWRHGARGADAS